MPGQAIPGFIPGKPGAPGVTSSGSLALAPPAPAGNSAQSSPDQPQVNPGTTWLALFRGWQPKPAPVPPAAQSINASGSLALAPLALSGAAGQTSPDVPRIQPGPWWLSWFKPGIYKPVPPVPAVQGINTAGSLTLAPLALSASGSQTSPDVPQILPGTTWLDLFKPGMPKPRPVPPAVQGVNATGSLSLAPIVFTAQGSQSSPDVPQVNPGTTWLGLFKPGMPRPRPWIPSAPSVGVSSAGSLSLAPLAFSAQGAQTSPDIPGILPGNTWLGLFKPGLPKPYPVPPAVRSVGASGSLVLAPLALSAQGARSFPDVPQVQPGPAWFRLFKPWAQRPVPPLPAQQAIGAAGSLALAPFVLAGAGAQSFPDVPQLNPGPSWLRLFKPGLKPAPQIPAGVPPTGVQAAGSFALAPLALSAQGAQSSPDLRQILPGPVWLDLFKPGLPKSRPFLPSAPLTGVRASGSLSLAPLAISAQGAQSSPDIPAVQPGPSWLRFFKPWAQRPVPPLPAVQGIAASGSLPLAPLALTSAGSQSSPDVPSAQPGPRWLRLFKPWIARPVPPVPAIPAISASGTFALAPLAFSGTAAVTGTIIPSQSQIAPGPGWLTWFRHRFRPVPAPPPAAVPSGTAIATELGEPFLSWTLGEPFTGWAVDAPEGSWTPGQPFAWWALDPPGASWLSGNSPSPE